MKVVDLGPAQPSLDEVVGLAKNGLVVLRQADGSVFALSAVDNFAVEVELLKANPEFLAYLQQRSKEKAVISLEELRKELAV
jgi:hypothetical protein